MLDLSKRQGELEGGRNHFTQKSMLDLSSSASLVTLGTKAGGHRQSMVELRSHPAASSDPRQRFSVASSGLNEQLAPHLRHYLVSDNENQKEGETVSKSFFLLHILLGE